MDKENFIYFICKELNGIDYTESSHECGWWETSNGADFGLERLTNILSKVSELFDDFNSRTCENCKYWDEDTIKCYNHASFANRKNVNHDDGCNKFERKTDE